MSRESLLCSTAYTTQTALEQANARAFLRLYREAHTGGAEIALRVVKKNGVLQLVKIPTEAVT